jgi:hypothetical protein
MSTSSIRPQLPDFIPAWKKYSSWWKEKTATFGNMESEGAKRRSYEKALIRIMIVAVCCTSISPSAM